jgi:hypothetical protein
MSTFRGTACLTDPAGKVIKPEVSVELSDDRRTAPSYLRWEPFYGQMWVSEGDLMIDPLRDQKPCILQLDEGPTLEVRVTSWDRGGSRAQLLGEGPELPPWQQP